jgi:type II secretory pathway pseudopilin PulG
MHFKPRYFDDDEHDVFPSQRRFNVIELTLVLVTLASIATIALPRFTRAASGNEDLTLVRSLRTLRAALEYYATDHQGTYPAVADVERALTCYSDPAGEAFSPTKNRATGAVLGPYLRDLPLLSVESRRRGSCHIAGADAPDVGWIYTINAAGIGDVQPNTAPAETDGRGVPYDSY